MKSSIRKCNGETSKYDSPGNLQKTDQLFTLVRRFIITMIINLALAGAIVGTIFTFLFLHKL